MLTSELRANGDLDIAAPPTMEPMDIDSKDPLSTPFTQKLQLFVCSPTSAISSFVVTITQSFAVPNTEGSALLPQLDAILHDGCASNAITPHPGGP